MIIKAEAHDDAIKIKVSWVLHTSHFMVKWLEDELDVKGKLARHISGHDQSTAFLLRSG